MLGTGCSGNQEFGHASPGGREITPVHHGGPSAGRSPRPSPDGSPAADSPGGSSAASTGRQPSPRVPNFTRAELGLSSTPSTEYTRDRGTSSPEL